MTEILSSMQASHDRNTLIYGGLSCQKHFHLGRLVMSEILSSREASHVRNALIQAG